MEITAMYNPYKETSNEMENY